MAPHTIEMKGTKMRANLAALTLLLLAGCAHAPGEERLAEQDPLEGFNRGMWTFNRAVDTVALKPVTKVYRAVTPRPARRGLSRLLANLSEPYSMINNVLQGKPKRAVRNFGRFAINSTLGVAGLADHATGFGIAPAEEDFGQTLARWGANAGPYLVLPILGPSTMRDGIGSGVGMFANPWRVALGQTDLTRTQRLGITAGEIVVIRSDLAESGADTFLDTSLDPYAAARSAFLQRRHAEIRDDEEETVSDMISGGGEADASTGSEAPEAPVADTTETAAQEPEAAPLAVPADPQDAPPADPLDTTVPATAPPQ